MKRMLIFFPLLLASCSANDLDPSVGIREIIVTGESSMFVQIGDRTQAILKSKGDKLETCSFRKHNGDLDKPYGNGDATLVVLVECGPKDRTAIRLKRANKSQYHILGYSKVEK